MKNFLLLSAALLCLVLIPCIWMVSTEVASAVRLWGQAPLVLTSQVSRVLDGDLASKVLEERQSLRSVLLERIDLAGASVNKGVDKQVTALRADVKEQVVALRADVVPLAHEVVGTSNEALKVVRESVGVVDSRLASIQADAKPVLENSALLIKDVQDSWDSNYDDMVGLLGSVTVATTQTAYTMESIRKATPQFLDTFQETNKQISGITTDVHTFTTKFTAPLTTKQKIWAGFKSMALISSRFLP